jgi:hypothetical protein
MKKVLLHRLLLLSLLSILSLEYGHSLAFYTSIQSHLCKRKEPRKQYYVYAGILPILKDNNKKVIVLGKVPHLTKQQVYGDFGGNYTKEDNNNPMWTAARHFSQRSSSSYDEIFSMIKQQCKANACTLKSNNGRYIVYPLEIQLKNLDSLKNEYVFLDFTTLKQQLQNKCKNATQTLEIKTNAGVDIVLRAELVEALINNITFLDDYSK